MADAGVVYRGENSGVSGKGPQPFGFGKYYAEKLSSAKVYAGDKGNVISKPKLKNPFVYDYSSWDSFQKEIKRVLSEAKSLGVYTGEFSDDVTAVAKKLGHDGIKVIGQGLEIHF